MQGSPADVAATSRPWPARERATCSSSLDPITLSSIEWLAEALAILDAAG